MNFHKHHHGKYLHYFSSDKCNKYHFYSKCKKHVLFLKFLLPTFHSLNFNSFSKLLLQFYLLKQEFPLLVSPADVAAPACVLSSVSLVCFSCILINVTIDTTFCDRLSICEHWILLFIRYCIPSPQR